MFDQGKDKIGLDLPECGTHLWDHEAHARRVEIGQRHIRWQVLPQRPIAMLHDERRRKSRAIEIRK
jgi:hypothetical protein